MKKVKPILHVCEIIQGGIASYLEEIGTLQIGTYGIDNVRFAIPDSSRKELPSIPDQCIIPIRYKNRSSIQLFLYTWQVYNILRKHRPSLVHAHSTFAGLAARVYRAIGVFRAPVVYCAHGWAFLMDVSLARRRVYASIERALAPFADAIVNISRHEHDWALKMGLPRDKCHLVQNGIGPGRTPMSVRLPASRINLLFAGRLDRTKGLDVLLEAMRQLRRRDIHLYVAGEVVIDRVTTSDTKASADVENITFLGWLTREELDAHYAAADALVMPSRWEGFGLAAVEAMRQSTAVIASDRGALPEIVVPDVTGLLCPADDPHALANALENLDKDRLRQWGQAGLVRQRELFSSSRVHRQLNEIYGALGYPAGGTPAPREGSVSTNSAAGIGN